MELTRSTEIPWCSHPQLDEVTPALVLIGHFELPSPDFASSDYHFFTSWRCTWVKKCSNEERNEGENGKMSSGAGGKLFPRRMPSRQVVTDRRTRVRIRKEELKRFAKKTFRRSQWKFNNKRIVSLGESINRNQIRAFSLRNKRNNANSKDEYYNAISGVAEVTSVQYFGKSLIMEASWTEKEMFPDKKNKCSKRSYWIPCAHNPKLCRSILSPIYGNHVISYMWVLRS